MNNRKYLGYVILILILTVGILLRFSVPNFEKEPASGSDGAAYHYAAMNLIKYGEITLDREGRVYLGEEPVVPTAVVQPGYPVFLSTVYRMFGASFHNAYYAQVILSITILILIYYLMKLLNIRNMAAMPALAIAAVYPGFIYNLDTILSEQLFTVLFMGFIYCFIMYMNREKIKWLIIANVLLVSAIYVRGHAIPFILVELFFILVYDNSNMKKRLQKCGIALSVIIICLIPWWIRNYIKFGEFYFITAAGYSPKIWGAQPYFLNMMDTNGRSLIEIVEGNKAANLGVYYKWRLFGFFSYMWYNLWDENLTHPSSVLWIFTVLQHIIIVPAVSLIPTLILKCNKKILMISCIPITFTLMNMIYHGLPRYVYPSIPFVIIIFALVIQGILSSPITIKNKVRKSNIKTKVDFDFVFRRLYWGTSILFSVILIFSVYVFSYSIGREMSEYRLGRYMNTNIRKVTENEEIQNISYDNKINKYTIDNVTVIENENYKIGWDAPAIINIDVPITQSEGEIVTKVIFNVEGGYLFDYSTIYWMGINTPEISEEKVYSFPKNYFMNEYEVYIDDDVSHLMIVPNTFRGGKFKVNSIDVIKYNLSK